MNSQVVTCETSSVRYHALDALRAWAMSMGIVLHAAWILIPSEAGAPATDASAHSFFEWLCLTIHTFRMQLFFVLAGFFACLLLRKRGFPNFARNRLLRIGLPMVTFWVVLCPVIMWQYNASGIKSGAIQSEKSAFELTREYFANISFDNTMLLHLWFLYYLAWAYVLTVAVRAFVSLFDRDGSGRQRASDTFRAMVIQPWAAFALAGLFAPMIMLMKGFWGVEVSPNSLVPKWPGMTTYLMYFVAGWLIFRNVDTLDALIRGWRWQLVVGLLLTVPYFYGNQVAIENGYATWNYPNLVVEDIRFDKQADRFGYPELRNTLIEAEEGSIARKVWNSLPQLNRDFVTNHEEATPNQLSGLLMSINLSVLVDPNFSNEFDVNAMTLSGQSAATIHIATNQRTLEQTMLLNREILEAGFGGVIRSEDTHRPFYYMIRASYAYLYSLITWLLILGCIGLFHTSFNYESKFWRYFSDSSYWMYLAHLPIQFQILLWIGDKPWPGLLKFSVYVFGTIAVLLPSYHFLVRPTWIGLLLNGKMYPILMADIPTEPRGLPPLGTSEPGTTPSRESFTQTLM